MISRLSTKATIGMWSYINRTVCVRPAQIRALTGIRKQHTHRPGSDAPVELEANPFAKDQPQCILCKHNISPDYKNVQLLSQFQSQYTGRVYGRHITGLCKQRHEQVEKEIIKSQNAGLMPTYHKAVEFLNDPKLFDPEKAVRPHKY
ncbi:small ribosomal subunit protein bS18m [Anopheles bellator]|uniref:small ribosomal subunit protein bS18m n=1 Tax=Anopheles bellator TaxID=139047 RepID=UPI002649D62D|nr:small ribosomal subunit protein bS18m [Anopheles bellator]